MPYYTGNLDGPMPLTLHLSPEASGPATLTVSGSVLTMAEWGHIGIEVAWEGETLGQAKIWSNGKNVHRAVVPASFDLMLDKPWTDGAPPSYELTLSPMNEDTMSDHNDVYHVFLAH